MNMKKTTQHKAEDSCMTSTVTPLKAAASGAEVKELPTIALKMQYPSHKKSSKKIMP